MAGTVMITNGGPHPAEKWAEVAAEDMVQGSPDMAGVVKEVLRQHFDAHQKKARGQKAKPPSTKDTIQLLTNTVAETEHGPHFAQKHVQAHLKRVVDRYTELVLQVEQDWAEAK